MRNSPNLKVEKYRLRHDLSMQCAGTNAGAFEITYQSSGTYLFVIASDGGGWDHVSVHVENRCPTWLEMCHVKDLFFKDDEVVMQLHPAKKDYVNCHQHTLHLWRPQTRQERLAIEQIYGKSQEVPDIDYPPIPLPPKVMI
jgi:hypothetical protein